MNVATITLAERKVEQMKPAGMKIRALAPWFGAKRSLAPTIVKQFGPHKAYWEPFCGSLAVLLAKPEATQETVGDLHGDLINLARCIIDPTAGPELYRKLRRTLVHEELFSEAAAGIRKAVETTEVVDPSRAYWFFVASWLGRNGVIGTKGSNNSFCVRYTSNGGIQGTRFAAAVDSIPAWRRRLREVTILKRDGFELLKRIEDSRATVIYCDPPYLQKGAKYDHDFAPDDHGRLAELLRRFKKTRVVVSYYDHPDIDRLYAGWSRLNCTVTKSLVNQGKRDSQGGAVKAPEVLLVNGPIL